MLARPFPGLQLLKANYWWKKYSVSASQFHFMSFLVFLDVLAPFKPWWNLPISSITNSATTTTLSDGKFVILVLAGNMKNNDDEECQWKELRLFSSHFSPLFWKALKMAGIEDFFRKKNISKIQLNLNISSDFFYKKIYFFMFI